MSESNNALMTTDTIIDNIRSKIMNEFANFIPKDQWDKMIKQEIDDLMSPDNKNRKSYKNVILKELEQETQKRITQYFESADWQQCWDNYGNPQASEAIKKIIIENSGLILQNMMAHTSQMMFGEFVQKMKNFHFNNFQ